MSEEDVKRACDLFDKLGPLSHKPQGYALGQQPSCFGVAGLEAHAWWEVPEAVAAVLAKVDRSEMLREFRVLASTQQATEKMATVTGEWRRYGLLEEGEWVAEHCAWCPQTVAMLRQLPLCESVLGQAYFSVIGGKTRIKEHYGPTNVKLRLQVCLSTGEGCTLRVGGVTKSYDEKSVMCFDDSFAHSVYNKAEAERVVLLFDVWHPRLTGVSRALLAKTLSKDAMCGVGAKRSAPPSLVASPTKADILHDSINRLHLLPIAMQSVVCSYLSAMEVCRLGASSRMLRGVASSEEVWKALSVRDGGEEVKLAMFAQQSSSSSSSPAASIRRSVSTSAQKTASTATAATTSTAAVAVTLWKAWYQAEVHKEYVKIEALPRDYYDGIVRLLLLGSHSGGKLSFVSRYIDDTFMESFPLILPTIDIDFRVCSVKSSSGVWKLQMWFRPRRPIDAVRGYIKAAAGIFIMFDVSDRLSFSEVRFWSQEIDKHGRPDTKRLLVGLQIDKPDRQVSAAEGRALAKELGIGYVECSSKTGEGVAKAVYTILSGCTALAEARNKPAAAKTQAESKSSKCVMQ